MAVDRRPALHRPVHRRLSSARRPQRAVEPTRHEAGRASLARWISRPPPPISCWVPPARHAAGRRGRCVRRARPRSSRDPRWCAPVRCRSLRPVSTHGVLRLAIVAWKEEGRAALLRPLAHLLAASVVEVMGASSGPCVLVPVPTSRRSRLARGARRRRPARPRCRPAAVRRRRRRHRPAGTAGGAPDGRPVGARGARPRPQPARGLHPSVDRRAHRPRHRGRRRHRHDRRHDRRGASRAPRRRPATAWRQRSWLTDLVCGQMVCGDIW